MSSAVGISYPGPNVFDVPALSRVRWRRVVRLLVVTALGASVLMGALASGVSVSWGRVGAAGTSTSNASAASSTAGSMSTAAGDGAMVLDPVLREHVVTPGDTLWRVATQIAPDRDPREVVDRIIQLNGLDQAAGVQVGTVLLIPAL